MLIYGVKGAVIGAALSVLILFGGNVISRVFKSATQSINNATKTVVNVVDDAGEYVDEATEVIEHATNTLQQGIVTDYNNELTFASDEKFLAHIHKHGSEFKGMFNSVDEYLQGARDVMKNGYKVEYMVKDKMRNGYVQFMGNNSKGNSKLLLLALIMRGILLHFILRAEKRFGRC